MKKKKHHLSTILLRSRCLLRNSSRMRIWVYPSDKSQKDSRSNTLDKIKVNKSTKCHLELKYSTIAILAISHHSN